MQIPKIGSYKWELYGLIDDSFGEMYVDDNCINAVVTNLWISTRPQIQPSWDKYDSVYNEDVKQKLLEGLSEAAKEKILKETKPLFLGCHIYGEGVDFYIQIFIVIGEEKLINGVRLPNNFTDVLEDINFYKPSGSINGIGTFGEKVSVILSVITNLGLIISVLIPMILGVKYMLGSVEEKAEYKKDLLPYLIGAILLFGISTIVKILQQIGNSINNS